MKNGETYAMVSKKWAHLGLIEEDGAIETTPSSTSALSIPAELPNIEEPCRCWSKFIQPKLGVLTSAIQWAVRLKRRKHMIRFEAVIS